MAKVIGIDVTRISPQYVGGTNTFTLGLISGFYENLDSRKIVLFVSPNNIDFFRNYLFDLKIFDSHLVLINSKLFFFENAIEFLPKFVYQHCSRFIFHQYRRIVEKNCDVLYIPTGTLRYQGNIKNTFLSMHDVQHNIFPEFFTKKELKRRNTSFLSSVEYCKNIQASSRFMEAEFLTHLGKSGIDVKYIPEGVSDYFLSSQIEKVGHIDNLPDKFVFYPAQLWLHKNHLNLLKAVLSIKIKFGFSIPVVLTGDKYTASEAISDFIEENNLDNILFLGKVSVAQIKFLFKKCHFLVVASIYESSSLPILEAAACGTTILASNIAPNVELSHKFNFAMFDPYDPKSIEDSLLFHWRGEPNSIDKINNLTMAKEYRWSIISKMYLNWFQENSNADI